MALTLSINAVLAFLSVPIATEKKQPVPLWTGARARLEIEIYVVICCRH